MSLESVVSNSNSFDIRQNKLMAGNNKNLFAQVTQRFGVLAVPGHGLNDISQVTEESTQTFSSSPLDQIGRDAEFMAEDVVLSFVEDSPKKAPNRYCKTLRRTVKELSNRHDLVFKGMVNRLQLDENNAFQTFVIVADEIFDDGQVNWGRIVAVYSFAARVAKYYSDSYSKSEIDTVSDPQIKIKSQQRKIAMFVGKYVANKLGKWILDHGGWDGFVEYFPDQGEFEENVWKGVLLTALGLGALATVVASR